MQLHTDMTRFGSKKTKKAHEHITQRLDRKLLCTMTKLYCAALLLLVPLVYSWAPQQLPSNLRSEERTWRFPESTQIRQDDSSVGSSPINYMSEMRSQPEPWQLRRSSAMASASGDYMTAMWSEPEPNALRQSDASAPYLDTERMWGFPSPARKPLTDNVLIAPKYSDLDRTWGFPASNKILQREVHLTSHLLDPMFISDVPEEHEPVGDKHVKTLLFKAEKHLPDWKEADVTEVLSEMEENISDFEPPEAKEKAATTLYYRSKAHLPDALEEKAVHLDFDDMAPGPEYLL